VRTDPDRTAGELEQITQYLDYQRATLLAKTDGLDRAGLAATLAPSTLTLGGLLNHLALVEDDWMQVLFSGMEDAEPWASVDWEAEPDWDLRSAADVEPEELRRRYRDACGRSREVVRSAESLDQLSVRAMKDGGHFSLRWALLHLIEETARHNGHADLIRQSVDGSVGE
jgi:uncharacterized damage-inducible protein DinB